MIRFLCIAGPTASGKTSLSIELAKRFNGEIISADSMQVYRGIHVASAAPSETDKQGIPHHLIEFLDLSQGYTVADYVQQAGRLIEEITVRGKLPIVVGGTGLYMDALTKGLRFVEEPTDPALRAEITGRFETLGAEEMLRRLSQFDPQAAARLHPNDKRRIIRAFEIYESTGKTVTQANEESHPQNNEYDTLQIAITCRNRELLYERIDRRVDIMLENGLLQEAETTLCLPQDGGAAQAIGHKELYPYLRGELDLDTAVENLKRATRRYAKRQLTWLRRNEQLHWLYTDEDENYIETAAGWVEEWRNNL